MNSRNAFQLVDIRPKGHGAYRVTIADAHGMHHHHLSHDLEAIDAIRQAGREPAANNDGTYERVRREFAATIAASLGLA